MKNLSDLEELILACRSDSGRSYITEAVACYNAGAYRACIVTTWIAVVFDLIDKIRELSGSGEESAKEELKRFEGYQKQIYQNNKQGIKDASKFEREILETIKNKFELLDHRQFEDLNRLRDDRHACAHPSFQKIEEPYNPTAELARLHIKNAVEHVLKQPPIQGKIALGKLKSLVKFEYLSEDLEDAIIRLKDSPLANPSDALVRGFIDILIFDLLLSDAKERGNIRRIIAAINACLEMHREVAEERIKQQINKAINEAKGDLMLLTVALAVAINQGWGFLNKSSKSKIKNYIREGEIRDISRTMHRLVEIVDLKDVVSKRISKLTVHGLSSLISMGGPKRAYIDSAIARYCDVQNYKDANEIADLLMLPLVKHLTKDDIKKIIRSAGERKNDLVGSIGFYSFVDELAKESIITDEKELIKLLVKNGLEEMYEAPQA